MIDKHHLCTTTTTTTTSGGGGGSSRPGESGTRADEERGEDGITPTGFGRHVYSREAHELHHHLHLMVGGRWEEEEEGRGGRRKKRRDESPYPSTVSPIVCYGR